MKEDPTYQIQVDSLTRTYVVHEPVGWDKKTPIPMLLGFHGGGGHAGDGRHSGFYKQSGFAPLSDRKQFLLVLPNGTGPRPDSTSLFTWNAFNVCCGAAVKNNIDDINFITQLISVLKTTYPISKTYATGFSNGAMFVYALAKNIPDLLNGIAPVSGDMSILEPAPSTPMKLIHFHGLLDQHCPYSGGIGTVSIDKINHQPIDDVIATWVKINNCDPKNVTTTVDYELDFYTGDFPVSLYKILNGGHQWAGGIDLTPNNTSLGYLNPNVHTSKIICEFFNL